MNNVSLPVNRIYKDRLYKMIFNDKSELLKLYNAINGTHYDDPAMLTMASRMLFMIWSLVQYGYR